MMNSMKSSVRQTRRSISSAICLVKAFITPIEREDIAALSHDIDEVTDKIEDVLIRVYINNVQQIRPEALRLLDTVIECCDALHELMQEFPNFRKSKEAWREDHRDQYAGGESG